MRPRIGIPVWRAPPGERFHHYEESLRQAGGEPVRLLPGQGLEGLQGLLLTGGVDIDPALYGQRRHPATQRPNKERDRHELSLLREAIRKGVPILGICRGHQLINVALGGSLLQHLADGGHQAQEDDSSSWHPIRVEGFLAELYGHESLWVNSRHHQAVTPGLLGRGIVPLAYSSEGLVEALQVEDHPWAVGVQWHPERPEMRLEREERGVPLAYAFPLFAAFVEACQQFGSP